MTAYNDWFKKAWDKLQRDYQEKRFKPLSENDITAHLYHCLFSISPNEHPRPILTTERSVKIEGRKRKRRLDLAVVKRNNLRLRYIVEVKETGSPRPKASNIMRAITGDIKKLGKIRNVENNVRQRPIMVYFCRKLRNRYIDEALENELDDRIKKYNDSRIKKEKVKVLFGPLRPRNERL